MFLDPRYFLFVGPALLLAFWAQMKVRSTYAAAQREPAPLSGAAAARYILNSAGLNDVQIEEIPGVLSDHYDPRAKVLRLSSDIYRGKDLAAVGIAAHESGHAIQDAHGYAPLVIRNAAVPVASFGSGIGVGLFVVGLLLGVSILAFIGLALFASVAFFQLVNLPVEFDASNRAKEQLVALGIVPQHEMPAVNRVLNAAAWTYVAATLQSVLTLLYYVMLLTGGRRND